MLEGMFSDAERHAREAIEVAAAASVAAPPAAAPAAAAAAAHATTTLGVSLGWGSNPQAGVQLLREARRMADELGDRAGSLGAAMLALDLVPSTQSTPSLTIGAC